jgi:hypothetical protein
MQCSRCGAPVQQGTAFCPNCGTPYPSAQNAPIPPTQYAGPSSYDPTVMSQPYNGGQGFPPPANPYAPQAPAPYETPGGYGTPPPPSNAFNAQSAYGTPPPPPNMYGAPYAPPPGAFMPQAQPPRKKWPNVGLIIGIVVLLILVVGGGALALKGLSHPGSQTNTNTPTPGVTTTTSSSNVTPGPSGSPIDTGAAAIISNVQTTSTIDSNYLPTNVTRQFKVGNVVYVTYHLNLTQSGYVEAKVYLDGTFGTQTSLAVTLGQVDHGYFNITYQKPGTGAFELYWCLQKDCGDAKLGAVATFTVS